MGGTASEIAQQFINLDPLNALFLVILGFLGGLISGFIGSGGAFVLTPGMMSLGVPGAIAVATNMCHKFPKALVGAWKRYKYGQVDIKLGLILAISATAGVQVGIRIQKTIFAKWGSAGSDLYVSLAFITVLTILGTYVLADAIKTMKGKGEESTTNLARKVQKIKIWPVVRFPVAGSKISLWFTLPVGFATGMLAATIAVGGFIGVPGMIYILGVPALMASATELIIAFVMGLSGTITWALGGFVDIRMVLLILGGSLIGVQFGAIGTTYVKEYTIKLVMATIMLIVSLSRAIAMPIYLHKLGKLTISPATEHLLKNTSFIIMCLALAIGGIIILGSMWKGKKELQIESEAITATTN